MKDGPIYRDPTRGGVGNHFLAHLRVFGKHVQSQWMLTAVHEGQCFINGINFDNWLDWSEDLFLHYR